ncbi:MAG: GDYXXLXY domain-containing protein [Fluviicola sp.]|nr:GDYXXLXY domain-containing protein [Fluviicola sp.]
MKTTTKLLIGLAVVSIIQLTFPLFFISAKEQVIEDGKEYLFRIQPVDPYDFFQGRYVSLNVQPLSCSLDNPDDFKRYDIVYAEFEQDSLGATIKQLSHEKTEHSLKLKLYGKPNKKMRIRLPFKRFFLEENKAKHIELKLSGNSKHRNYVHVKILDGDFVMTDISSNGKSLITGKPVQLPTLLQ